MPASNHPLRGPDTAPTDAAGTDDGGGHPFQPSSGRGRPHGTSGSEPFDRWFRYPAGFASDYVSTLLEHLELDRESLIIDPFAGSAVTGTAARRAGLSFYGIEAHPLIAELGRLKLQRSPANPVTLNKSAQSLTYAATNRIAGSEVTDLSLETELIRRSFSDSILTELTVLRAMIREGYGGEWSEYLKWALLATLRDVASVRVGWPYQRPGSQRQPRYTDVFGRFQRRAMWMAEDLNMAANTLDEMLSSTIVRGDARATASWAALEPGSAQGCVSSPPYLNNFDYADATRLELYFWGEVTSWSQMCSTVRADMITATTQQSNVASANSSAIELQRFEEVAATIEDLTSRLSTERAQRKRGKEYDRVLPAYFAAISQVLTNMANALTAGAPVVLLIGDSAPYGVYVDTPRLIAELAQLLGFSAEKDIILRRRGLRWTSSSLRHGTELSERLVLLRRL